MPGWTVANTTNSLSEAMLILLSFISNETNVTVIGIMTYTLKPNQQYSIVYCF